MQALTDELESSHDAAQTQENQLRAQLADAQFQVQLTWFQIMQFGFVAHVATPVQNSRKLLGKVALCRALPMQYFKCTAGQAQSYAIIMAW